MATPLFARLTVLLVDSHPVYRAGLHAIFTADDRIQIVGETDEGRCAIRLVDQFAPDVVVTEFDLVDGTALLAIRAIKSAAPWCRVLVVSARADMDAIVAALDAGADGYLAKSCLPNELRSAVRKIKAGERVLDRTALSLLVDHATGRRQSPIVSDTLSARERDILGWLASGATSKEIATQLGLRPKTVENHRARILDKLGAANSAAAVRIGTAAGLLGQNVASASTSMA